jgi:very-short-patch-repair endonuclease
MVYLGKSIEREMYYGAKPDLFRLAMNMRKNPTEAEQVLWKRLKKLRKEGYIFRRQHPIDIFIADFYCHKLKLIIEVDGEVHFNSVAQERDDGRTGELERFGIQIIRFTNEQVLEYLELVINKIRSYIDIISSPALPGAGDKRG